MRIRKIHTVLAVSVALMLVARTIESRRRTETWAPSEAASPPAEPVVAAVEPVAEEPVAEEPVAEAPVAEEPIAEGPTAEEPVAISSGRRTLGKPLALLAAAIVLAGALAGTLLVVTAGAAPPHP